MKRSILLPLLLLCATRTALAVTCGGFSIVPGDHVLVKYSAPVASGATHSSPQVSVIGDAVSVTRMLSGGSSTDVACVEDTTDLGYLGAGRFNLTWNDNTGFTNQRSSFTFFVGSPAAGTADETSVLPPVNPNQPVRVAVNACSQRAALAYLPGNNNIQISQYGIGSPCKLYVIEFGLLPEGVYHVTTTHLDSTGGTPVAKSFDFVVQQPAPSSACSGTFSITRTERGTARLHYEDRYTGYTPVFGAPAVTEISQFVDASNEHWPVITVVQPVADTADTTRLVPGSVPPVCHAEDIDIGIPADGYNEIQWYDQVTINGHVAGFQNLGTPVGFRWSNGMMQCSAFPRAFSPAAAIEGQPIHLTLSMLADEPSVLRTTVNGHTITLDIIPSPFEGPVPPYPPECETWDATLSPLPAGEYTVSWRVASSGGVVLQGPITSSFTVVKPTRQRAARH